MGQAEDHIFETEVLRIARARWPQAQYSGAAMINGRERDGVFETDEVVHFIEATTSKRADKAKEDTKKIFQLMSDHQKTNSIKGAVGWFITQTEPTAEQREAVKTAGKNQVKAASFAQFQQAVIDVASYFSFRENHLFGSVADPISGEINYKGEYIPLELLPLNNQETIKLDEMVNGLYEGKTYTVLGEYGAGKSMTLREIYFKSRDRYRKGESSTFPIYINLREHSGQDDAAEMLERHARKIGFERPSNLVSAWRAGFVILLIDGFDEITSLGTALSRSRLKEARRRSLEAVRKLLDQTPRNIGYVVSGREHFFSSPDERKSALSLRTDTTTILLGELNKKQVADYIKRISGKNTAVPEWLPTRPLLVSYLATRGILQQSENILSSIDSIDGWDLLLNQICDREAKISPSLDGPTLRSILERLSTMARSSQDGLGPITQEQIRVAFIQVCGYEPDDQANLLLQRLPGLGIYRHEDDSRTFVDIELASVCRAKDICLFVSNPYEQIQNEGWLISMRQVGESAGKTSIIRACRNLKNSPINIESVFQVLKSNENLEILKSDIAMICIEMPCIPKTKVTIENAVYENYSMSPQDAGCSLENISFKDCLFDSIEVGDNALVSNLPYFDGCIFLFIQDRINKSDMPAQRFSNSCTYERFSDSVQTQNSILNASLSIGEKLVLTILRKVFIQSLSGRSETALVRGLDLNTRHLVPEAIKLLQQQDLLFPANKGDGTVWIPVRKQLNRVRGILSSPSTCNDSLLTEAKELSA